ncbi:TetR/AcrR family transcriptional regulator [Burkholderia sp. Bp8963]|uniref:TetR/AcrR family transcriptional regulator n=1 Tax=Burkholderia sp. Bp8963 TaxID=2184547 RepID=UPI000F5A2FDA|nr:TetR/AcrR family transcriptional regulator [Burkholderia sp. Bp8963]RQS71262.1 TetR/AcrR family transcriptional regulator [Burkholderia sp. Bp8963]
MTELLSYPRKRPRQARSAAMFEVILEASARIVESSGFDGFNTNAVADLAGVSIGSLYQYFPSKHALIVELIRRGRAQLTDDVIEAIQVLPGAGLEGQIDRIIEAAVRHQLDRPALARTLEYASTMIGSDLEADQLQRELETRVADLLHRHGIPDEMVAARDIVALSKGMINAAGVAGESDKAALKQRVRRAVFGYLGLARAPQGA